MFSLDFSHIQLEVFPVSHSALLYTSTLPHFLCLTHACAEKNVGWGDAYIPLGCIDNSTIDIKPPG